MFYERTKTLYLGTLLSLVSCTATGSQAIEEVIITAQKWEQTLQKTPISVSTLEYQQLETLGVTSLDALESGIIPSLRIQPTGLASSTKLVAIRGNGPSATNEVGRDGPVAVYKDGVYLSRAQGLNMELVDLQRIEVLRGPQGTLFGRNAIAGAISLISKQPTGEFGFEQKISRGNYDVLHTVTRINLPETFGIKTKLSYASSERDGWVNNPGGLDYNMYDKDGVRFSIEWEPADDITVNAWHEDSNVESTQVYLQLYHDFFGNIGAEPHRETETRYPISTLDPTKTNMVTNALNISWRINDQLIAKSISAQSQLTESTNNNFGGVLYSNGLIVNDEMEHDQVTQELQLIGDIDTLQWVSGVYYLKEKVDDDTQFYFTRDSFGCITGTPNTPITKTTVTTICDLSDPTNISLGVAFPMPLQENRLEAKSKAIYSQATWALFSDKQFSISLGLRYTEDEKSGSRQQFAFSPFDIENDHLDKLVTLAYEFSDNVNTYLTWGTAYRAGGIGLYSNRFLPYEEEESSTWELGLKSKLWDNRIRLNGAFFTSRFDAMQIDFADPVNNVGNSETFNATEIVKVTGTEVDLTIVPVRGLALGLHYTYLDGDMPDQPNPIADGELQSFEMSQTPKHSGAFTADYRFKPWSFGALSAHIDITATSDYAYLPYETTRFDAYKLVNMQVSLSNIKLGNSGNLNIAAWVKNVTDEEYVVLAFPTVQAFGHPRTTGIELSYTFN